MYNFLNLNAYEEMNKEDEKTYGRILAYPPVRKVKTSCWRSYK